MTRSREEVTWLEGEEEGLQHCIPSPGTAAWKLCKGSASLLLVTQTGILSAGSTQQRERIILASFIDVLWYLLMGRDREKLCGICILCTSLQPLSRERKYFIVLAVDVLGACCSMALGLYWCGWYIPWLSVSHTHWPVTAEMPLFCHVVTQKKLLCHAAGLGTGGGCACWWCGDKCHQFRVLSGPFLYYVATDAGLMLGALKLCWCV